MRLKFQKVNFFKRQLHKTRFILLFIKDLGGGVIFITKILKIFREHGFSGIFDKIRYILFHAGLQYNASDFRMNYEEWLEAFSSPQNTDFENMGKSINKFNRLPIISVIMPTWNSNPKWLTEAIGSVRNQIYPHWELCIADDASTNVETIRILKQYLETDLRVKVVFREQNGHISLASNSALEIVTGDFVALMDHDDILPKDALFWVADAINKNPEAALLYSDEDKIDNAGKRSDPYFKCDWNYTLFLSQNMINHLGVYSTRIVKDISGFRQGYEGSQDYDMALRFIEKIAPEQIIHIPRILYHWRNHQNSTAKNVEVKPYSLTAAQKAIFEHLERRNIDATVEILPNKYLRTRFHLDALLPLVSIIIPTKNNKKLLEKCIQSLFANPEYKNFEVLVVNNNSDETDTINYLEKLGKMDQIGILSYPKSFNFSAINNFAVQKARGEFVCFMNDDTEIISNDWLSEMVSIGKLDGVGAVGAKLYYPDDIIQHGGVILGIGGVAGHSHKYFKRVDYGYFGRVSLMQELSAVTGACMLVRKDVFLKSGGFDEQNLPIAFNDIDLCLKIRNLGYKIIWTPFAELYHHESISRGDDLHPEKIERFLKENDFMLHKWSEIISNDPYYSPNLTLSAENFSLAWPPRIIMNFDNL